jgi:arginine exporter protein ArgO
MPLGIINVAIVQAASSGRGRFATGIGLGGALADTAHAAIAFVGVGRVIAAHPAWTRGLAIAAACIVLGYVALAWRARPAQPRERGSGIVTGLLLTLPNPAALGAWIAVAGALWPQISTADALVLAAGVGVGSAGWFTLLARWMANRAVGWLPRAALVLIAAIAIAGVIRAV